LNIHIYIKNYSLLILLTAISQICALLVTTHIAKIFGPSIYGEINLVITITMLTGILIDFGMNNYFTREVARNKNTSEIINFCFSVKIGLSILSSAILIIIGIILNNPKSFALLCIIWSGTLIISFLDFRWFFVAQQKSWIPSLFSAIGQLVLTVIIVTTLRSEKQVVYYGILSCFCTSIFPVSTIYLAFIKNRGVPRVKFIGTIWPNLKKEIFPLAISNVCTVTNTYFPPLIIGSTITLNDLGIYSAAFKPVLVIIISFNLITLVSTPAIAKVYEEKRDKFINAIKMFLFVMISAGLFSSLLMTFIAPYLINLLFGNQYISSIYLLRIWTLGLIPFLAISIVFSSSLIPCNASKSYSRLAIVTTIVLIVSTICFARYFGANAIPFANVLSEGVMALGGFILFTVKIKLSREEIKDIFNMVSSFRQLRNDILPRLPIPK
jgi:O-antigen/teichoic acid export membrane protein